MEVVKKVQPPSGPLGLLLRLPVHFYNAGLGWLFGSRMLLINHVGRVTGKQRQVVLELIEHDREKGRYVVASGWGHKAAWYRNLLHTPDVTIKVGNRSIPVTAVPMPPEEAIDFMEAYYWRNRHMAKRLLPHLYGYSVDGSRADFREVAENVPVMTLVTRA